MGSAAREALAEVWNLRRQAVQGVSETANTPPRTRLLGEEGGGSNCRASPTAGVQGCPSGSEDTATLFLKQSLRCWRKQSRNRVLPVADSESSSKFHPLWNLVASRLLRAMNAGFGSIRNLTPLRPVVSFRDINRRLFGNLVATW